MQTVVVLEVPERIRMVRRIGIGGILIRFWYIRKEDKDG